MLRESGRTGHVASLAGGPDGLGGGAERAVRVRAAAGAARVPLAARAAARVGAPPRAPRGRLPDGDAVCVCGRPHSAQHQFARV